MRFKRHLGIEHGLNNIYIAPLVNVVLLLLIFFILTSNLVIQSGMKVSLPKALESRLIKYDRIEFYVAQDNKVYFNGNAVSGHELKDILKQFSARNTNIIIRSDKRASFETITQVWDACRSLGITQISLSAE